MGWLDVAADRGRRRLERERDDRDRDDRRQDDGRDTGAPGRQSGSRGAAGRCDHGRKWREPVFTALLSHSIVPGVLRRRLLPLIG